MGKNILVEPEIETNAFGVEMEKETGSVIAVGDEVTKVKVGEVLIWESMWAVKVVEIDDIKYRFIGEDSPFLLGIRND